ncbi:MAG: hypothetical protein K6347_00760 [Campylobacterales bacterium]
MRYPDFFDDVPTITLRDPLSDVLGSYEDGIIEYAYRDAVKLAGHSCPTVAGAYLMALKAITVLYPNQMPIRGAIKVEMRDGVGDGVTGVIASVLTLITGAAAEGGFKGIGGNFVRSNLLFFHAKIDGLARLTRVDTGQSVVVDYNPNLAPGSPNQTILMQKIIMGQATPEEKEEFKCLWQERVRIILCDLRDDPRLIILKDGS